MASEDLRKRLEALNGGPLAHAAAATETKADGRGGGGRRAYPAEPMSAVAVISAAAPSPTRLALTDSLRTHAGGETRSLADGREYYHIERPASDGAAPEPAWTSRVCRVLESSTFRDHLRRPATARPSEVLFLDLETLGLHGEPLFLIGLLSLGDSGAVCTQLLARGPDEESTILERCRGYLRGAKLLLTYNGRSFDVPFLKSRFERHGLRVPRIPTHVDLLVQARLQHKGQFRDCKLQTMERHLCGRERTGDIPGAQIPSVYRRCVESGDGEPLATVLLHNRLDLETTAELVSHFWTG